MGPEKTEKSEKSEASAVSGASDVVVVGAGHNGLVCAFYLAQAGLKVIG